MKLTDCSFLADENIHPRVIQQLRELGFPVISVHDVGLTGMADSDILRYCVSENRVILTHDSDFGMLAILEGEPIIGIIYLRPGHRDPAFTLPTLEAVFREDLDIDSPFILVAERRGEKIKMRIRKIEHE
jgi:predicted nuclease of predicted toxin-antitoxin system